MPHPRRTRRRTTAAVALFAAVAAVLTACTSATIDGTGTAVTPGGTASSGSPGGSSSSTPSGGASSPSQPAANFVDCSQAFNLSSLHFPAGRLAQLQFTCALVKVPLDYANSGKGQIGLTIVRVHDRRDSNPTGQLLMNPGGPGASGISLAVGLSPKMPQTVLDHFDLIGFDPRGVQNSSPIRCTTDSRKDALNAASPNVLTRKGFQTAQALAKSVATACNRKYGAALQYYDTVNTARDMDRIRQAVGDSKMNYLGFSYGTELGSVYAHLFPNNVRAMVLDGAVDPLTSDIVTSGLQLKGFEGAFDQFAAYCRRTKPCSSLSNARRTVYAIQAAARRAPLKVPGQNRRVTYQLATTGVLQALYSRSTWPKLARALLSGRRGNGTLLLSLADEYNQRLSDGTYTNISDANTTINCNDARRGPTNATIKAVARRWARQYPMFGPFSGPSLFTCQQWQPDRTPVPPRTAKTPRTVLVIGNLHDPATPYKGAIDLAKAMGNAQVLSWNGQGHTSYLEGSGCINGYVNTYLVSGKLPPKNRLCPA